MADSSIRSGRADGGLIWLGDVDPRGRPLDPDIKFLAYSNESQLAKYRSAELLDKAQIACLIEESVYRTSEAVQKRPVKNPAGYLYTTYKNLVDQTLLKTVQAFGMEQEILGQLAKTGDPERTLIERITRQKLIDSMDIKGRNLWERHLLGFAIEELAIEEGQSVDYLGKRLRRAVECALRRLLIVNAK